MQLKLKSPFSFFLKGADTFGQVRFIDTNTITSHKCDLIRTIISKYISISLQKPCFGHFWL